MAEVSTITLADIRANPALNEANLEPGDTYTVGKDGSFNINRVFSKPSSIDFGMEITQKHLDNQPELVEKWGASVGDRYVESQQKLIKTGKDSAWRQFWYGFNETGDLVSNITNTLTSWLDDADLLITPFGYDTPEQAFGKNWDTASSSEQRAMIRRFEERELLKKYGRYFSPDPDSDFRVAGQFSRVLADPTSAIPFVGPAGKLGKLGSLAVNAGVGGAVGGAYSVSEDLASGKTWDDIDLDKALTTALFASGGTAALIGAGRGLSKLKQSSVNKTATRKIDQADRIVAEKVATGVDLDTALKEAQDEIFSLSGMPLDRAISLTGRKVKIPSSKTKAEKILDNALEDQATSRRLNPKIDNWFGSLSTRIKNISEPVFMRMRKFEFYTRVNTAKYLEEINGFQKLIKSMPQLMKQSTARHLSNGNMKAAEELMNKYNPKMVEEWKKTSKVLNELGAELKLVDSSFKTRENYFPRLIKGDKAYTELQKILGSKEKGAITKILDAERRKLGYDKITEIPLWRRSQIINQALLGLKKGNTKSSFQKQRQIEKLDADMFKLYKKPEDVLQQYVRNAVNTIERGKFFGTHAKDIMNYRGLAKKRQVTENGITRTVDLEDSVGHIIDQNKIPENLQDELRSLLKSRFKGGERSPGFLIGGLRDFAYLGTIANPISALTQLGDLGVSGALHGFENTIAAMFKTKNFNLIDQGITDIGQEFADQRKSANALRFLFDKTGFRAIDRLGKETAMNAAFLKNTKLINRTSRGKKTNLTGEQEFRKKWGKAYGKDIDQVVADIKTGKVTEMSKFHAFNELSDMQPISMMEMPQLYLDIPNGRILYSLKTFTLKQWDVARRNVVQEYQKGNKKAAIGNALRLAGYLSAANVGTQTIKDFLLGKDIRLEDVPNKSMWALTGVYGINQYTSERYFANGKFKDGIINLIAPATPIFDSLGAVGIEVFDDNPNYSKYMRSIPAVGPMLYYWFGGGAEKYNERLTKGKNKVNPVGLTYTGNTGNARTYSGMTYSGEN